MRRQVPGQLGRLRKGSDEACGPAAGVAGNRLDGRGRAFPRTARRALVNGAAPASPPSASIANAGAPERPSDLLTSICSCYVLSCLARMSSPPTPTSSSGSPVDAAREGLLSPRPARRQIRRGNPDDGAPRPSRRRLRHLGHPPPRSPALRRLLRRPRLSCPAPRQAHRRHAAPPPRQSGGG